MTNSLYNARHLAGCLLADLSLATSTLSDRQIESALLDQRDSELWAVPSAGTTPSSLGFECETAARLFPLRNDSLLQHRVLSLPPANNDPSDIQQHQWILPQHSSFWYTYHLHEPKLLQMKHHIRTVNYSDQGRGGRSLVGSCNTSAYNDILQQNTQ